jgi:hypothetical protein
MSPRSVRFNGMTKTVPLRAGKSTRSLRRLESHGRKRNTRSSPNDTVTIGAPAIMFVVLSAMPSDVVTERAVVPIHKSSV